MTKLRYFLPALLLLGAAGGLSAETPSDQPKIVPVTRDEVKEALDQLKNRKPRFPRRERSDAEKKAREGQGTVTRAARERRAGGGGGGLFRGDDPVMTLEYPFATEIFWIVSRINNCHYCLGHQENKLLAAGLSDDRIAALDGDWTEFTPAEQAAFAFTRKLTLEPHLIDGSDIARLREHFTELQALEVVYYVARYNYMNRRTDGMGLAQQADRIFKTPTSDKYKNLKSTIALFDRKQPAGTLAPAAIPERPALEPRDVVLARLEECRGRKPRFALADDEVARKLLPDFPQGPLPQYARLLAQFPKTGVGAAESQRRSDETGELPPLMRARIAWISARHDRAWHALGRALAQLKALGQTDDEIFALDQPDQRFNASELAAFRLTEKFSLTPQRITDADVAAVREHYGDIAGAEIVSRNTQAAFLNRLTEAAGLPSDN